MRFTMPIRVRFADLDALGHVNHATVFTYFETARIGYVNEVLGWEGSPAELTLILARAEAEYKQPVHMGDAPVVGVAVTRLGTTSFDMAYTLSTPDGPLLAQGKTVLVVFDYAAGKPKPIPEAWREKITAYEPDL